MFILFYFGFGSRVSTCWEIAAHLDDHFFSLHFEYICNYLSLGLELDSDHFFFISHFGPDQIIKTNNYQLEVDLQERNLLQFLIFAYSLL